MSSGRLRDCRLCRDRPLLAGIALLIAACGPAPPPPAPEESRELIVLVRQGPTTWFAGPHGELSGFEHDLLARFAREQGLQLRALIAAGAADFLDQIAAGRAHVGAGGLFQAASPFEEAVPTDDAASKVLWTTGYFAVEPVLIYNRDGFKPKEFADLAGATVAYPVGTGLRAQLAATRLAHYEVDWRALDLPSSDALIAQVSEGVIDYALVPSSDAAIARNVYLDFDVAFTAGPKREIAWAVAPAHKRIRDALDAFLARLRADGTLARYVERYFAPRGRVERIDAGVMHERIRTVLPQFRADFEDAQLASGIEWRLLAAVAYQESQWDPFATSETGVRGFMQLTEETARRFRVADRLDARESTHAAARYLRQLKTRLPARIAEPDRTWLALAAFNIGVGHLEDARILAQKQRLDPDLWSDVKKTLPLLARPEHYETAKYGYARGGMPVVFVDRVRAYYDILLRTAPAYAPRLWAGTAAQPGSAHRLPVAHP
jgi:membrane-bound lytic murein transglycosylase F